MSNIIDMELNFWRKAMDLDLCLWNNLIGLEQFVLKLKGFGAMLIAYEAAHWIWSYANEAILLILSYA